MDPRTLRLSEPKLHAPCTLLLWLPSRGHSKSSLRQIWSPPSGKERSLQRNRKAECRCQICSLLLRAEENAQSGERDHRLNPSDTNNNARMQRTSISRPPFINPSHPPFDLISFLNLPSTCLSQFWRTTAPRAVSRLPP